MPDRMSDADLAAIEADLPKIRQSLFRGALEDDRGGAEDDLFNYATKLLAEVERARESEGRMLGFIAGVHNILHQNGITAVANAARELLPENVKLDAAGYVVTQESDHE